MAGFAPWNFPRHASRAQDRRVAGGGCSIIIKCPEETLAPIGLVKCFADAGVPAGVINLVYGVPAEISEYLIPHPIIRKVSFTGSVQVGKHLNALAASHMKRATMELGGHSPVLVFDDADVEGAAKFMGAFKYRNAGQVCVSPTRFFVHDKVYDSFVGKFSIQETKVGDGLKRIQEVVAIRADQAARAQRPDARTRAPGGDRGKRIGKGQIPPTVSRREATPHHEREPFGPSPFCASGRRRVLARAYSCHMASPATPSPRTPRPDQDRRRARQRW